MLTALQVRDFAIVDEIDVDFDAGMTVLTGETGAGKSILIDALGLVLGERGSSQLVRNGAKRAEFGAEFDVSRLPAAKAWLEDNALDQDDACLLRRVVNGDGRSRAFINGNAVPLQQLKALGEMLIDIHGQHFHQSLGRSAVQRELLDHFGALLEQRARTEAAYAEWISLRARLDTLLDADADRASRHDLLTFQLSELESLAPECGEYELLQGERQRLASSGRLAEGVASAVDSLSDGDPLNASQLIAGALRSVEGLVEIDETLRDVQELIDGAGIQIAEASDLLRRYAQQINADPERRDWLLERMDAFQAIARKHRVQPDQLDTLLEKLRNDHDELSNAEQRGLELEKMVASAERAYRDLATALSTARSAAAKSFSADVSEAMSSLGMPGGQFEAALVKRADNEPKSWGMEDVEYRISANPGQPLLSLARVASGGELSRMSLAIQVIASDGSDIPTMVFDEVDSGVGGGVAEMVGRRLAELGTNRQVLCVTHLPQVASLADQHFRVSKVTDGKATRTNVNVLNDEERVDELARMLGGVEITRKTLEHAAEMLAGAPKKRA